MSNSDFEQFERWAAQYPNQFHQIAKSMGEFYLVDGDKSFPPLFLPGEYAWLHMGPPEDRLVQVVGLRPGCLGTWNCVSVSPVLPLERREDDLAAIKIHATHQSILGYPLSLNHWSDRQKALVIDLRYPMSSPLEFLLGQPWNDSKSIT